MFRIAPCCFAVASLVLAMVAAAQDGDWLDLRGATVVIRAEQEEVEATATRVLIEEAARRAGQTWKTANAFPETGPVVELNVAEGLKAEGFHIAASNDGRPVVRIIGADGSGALYGVGKFLRLLDWGPDKALFPADTNIVTAPEYAIRGHQLGYRNLANSYDAWTPVQYEQYIRELSFFGVNAIENIPMSEHAPLMPASPEEMHRALSDICKRYGMQYWLFMPVLVDLEDEAARSGLLDEFERIYRGCEHITGIMIPGGDPGDHDVTLFAFAEEAAARLHAIHPAAGMWVSLQRFRGKDLEDAYALLQTEPEWLAGITAGPSAPPLPEMRERIPVRYPIRLYTDITHNKISQYPVPWWDQAYARTLGREAINPRPVEYAQLHNWYAPYSAGFVAYSDGVHDDVNKIVWAALGWDSTQDVRDIVADYGRVYFKPEIAEAAADGIFALERNWRGPLRYNAAVEGTLTMWEVLAAKAPDLKDNWRWQMNLVRADYDAFVRRRLLQEERLETEANAVMLEAPVRGADAAMDAALTVLAKADTEPAAAELRARIVAWCEALNQSIGLQTSVEKYQAMNPERGAILDLIDVPLNNRWWIEDEFAKIRAMNAEAEKVAALKTIATWERPAPGARYDAVGLSAKAPHVKRAEEIVTVHAEEAMPAPLHWWIDNGLSRLRLSWQTSVDYPEAVVYEALDPEAAYTVRVTGYGQQLLRIDGERVEAVKTGRDYGALNEFPVPAAALADRRIELTWDRPTDERHLNWREHSRLCEVWLLKQE